MAKIYLIYNTLNGKKYVGETTNCVSQRFCQHIDAAFRTYENKLNDFYKEIKESGEKVFEIFKFKILCECEESERFEKEIEYIKKIKPQYNEMFKYHYLYSIKDKLIEEYKNGMTITEMRKKYKCRHQFMSKILKINKVKVQKSRPIKSRKVYLFNEEGKIEKEWINAGECATELKVDRSKEKLLKVDKSRGKIAL